MESSYQGGVSYQGTPKSFEDQSQDIASNIKKISQNVSSMTKIVNQLQSPLDSQELRYQLRQIQHYTQKLAKDTSAMLMALMKLPVEQPAQRLARDRLSDEYMTTLNSFQATQKLAAQKTKEEVKKEKNAQPISLREPTSFSKQGRELVEMEEGQLQAQLEAEEHSLQELEQREQDYRQLETDIMDVNQIFKELGTMIHTQGATVDSIESNVEYTAHAVEAGAHQLVEAHNYKNKLRKKKVYIAIIVIIIVAVILILVFHHS